MYVSSFCKLMRINVFLFSQQVASQCKVGMGVEISHLLLANDASVFCESFLNQLTYLS